MIMDQKIAISQAGIARRIFTIHNTQVMLDSDLAEMYNVAPKRLNEQVKRNIQRFPESFRFQLTHKEFEFLNSEQNTVSSDSSNLRSQIATSSEHGGRRYLPYVFTEQGISMLSAVLRSETAIQVSIAIMNAFVHMRKIIALNSKILNRLDALETKQFQADKNFERIFKTLEENTTLPPRQGIFFDGHMFDAHKLVSDIIGSATQEIILIDNYVDLSVLILFSEKQPNVHCTIYTKTISERLELDVRRFNEQYGGQGCAAQSRSHSNGATPMENASAEDSSAQSNLEIRRFTKAHDRFIIIDRTTVYHIGASLKDLGKKWFAFTKIEGFAEKILQELDG